MTVELRYVGSASKSQPFGKWVRLPRRQGRELQLEKVSQAEALHAFDACMRERRVFLLETAFDASIEFRRTWWGGKAWLDCWSFESGLSEATISVDGARRLIELLYTQCAEADVLQYLKAEGARCEPTIAI